MRDWHLALLAIVWIGCDQTFAFDVHDRDSDVQAGIDANHPDQARTDAASCTAVTCPFEGGPCAGNGCDLHCEENATCIATCRDSCSAACEFGSNCSIAGNASASFDCFGADCTFSVGPSGSVTCNGGATCHVNCSGECNVSCVGNARCDLRCSGSSVSEQVNAGGRCP